MMLLQYNTVLLMSAYLFWSAILGLLIPSMLKCYCALCVTGSLVISRWNQLPVLAASFLVHTLLGDIFFGST